MLTIPLILEKHPDILTYLKFGIDKDAVHRKINAMEFSEKRALYTELKGWWEENLDHAFVQYELFPMTKVQFALELGKQLPLGILAGFIAFYIASYPVANPASYAFSAITVPAAAGSMFHATNSSSQQYKSMQRRLSSLMRELTDNEPSFTRAGAYSY